MKEDKKTAENHEAAIASKLEAIRNLEQKLAQMEVKVQQTDLVNN